MFWRVHEKQFKNYLNNELANIWEYLVMPIYQHRQPTPGGCLCLGYKDKRIHIYWWRQAMTEIMFYQNIMIPLQWHKGISGKWFACMAVGLEKNRNLIVWWCKHWLILASVIYWLMATCEALKWFFFFYRKENIPQTHWFYLGDGDVRGGPHRVHMAEVLFSTSELFVGF